MRPSVSLAADGASRAMWESAWLELVVHARHDAGVLERANALAAAGGPWTRLLDRFEREALVARAAALLLRLAPGAVPPPVLEDLRTRRHLHHATGLFQIETLRRLVEHLERSGVPVLAFKGPALGLLAHGAADQRGYGDLDVLVSPAHRFRAGQVLEALGYTPSAVVAPQGVAPARFHTSVAFEGPGRVDVDLHWSFSTPLVPFALARTGLWRRAREVDLSGLRCRTLGAEDTFLHTCFRGAKDDYVYWTALSDLAALLEHAQDLDWALVDALAERTGARRMLHVALLLAVDIAGAPVPGPSERRARADAHASALAHATQERLRLGTATSQGIRERLARAVRLRERTGDRVAAVIGAVTRVSEPRADEHWPAWTWPLRRPLRLLRDLKRDARPPLGGASSSPPYA